jgi:hypothetical protein
MTLALCSDVPTMPEQARRSVTPITEDRFFKAGAARKRDPDVLSKYLYSLVFSFYSAAPVLCGITAKRVMTACGEGCLPAPLPP